ncbi:MAG TPA: hypothetical protein DEQ09_01605 [Bacteroidales bacterium]|nr:hypothetical protein [Bacteroidales bacterium]
MWKPVIIIILFFSSHALIAQDWKQYPYEPGGSLIFFPSDEGRHPDEPVEWWYTTGHLTGETTGRTYSFMLSYFYSPVSSFDGFRIFNICDDESGMFFTDTKPLVYSTLSTDSLNIVADLYNAGTEHWHNMVDTYGSAIPFTYVLSAESQGASINLEYDAFKPPLILADSGLLDQGPEAYTYYYSLTGIDVTGTVNFNGTAENVNGSAWIDKQYGTVNPSEGLEYEWFSIQLSNGMDINLNNIFTADNDVPETLKYRLLCAYVDEQNRFTTSSFNIERLKYNYTVDRMRCYSGKWRLTCSEHNIDLIISSIHSDNEVILPFRFFEGPTYISGTVDGIPVEGKGFAELLHSYDKPDIGIRSITNLWEESTALQWVLKNPDYGNPLKYDLEYSIDNRETFNLIARDLTDTLYYWDSSSLSGEIDIWLKVRAYSIDTTLVDSCVVRLGPVTGIGNTGPVLNVNIFPNPNNGHFTISGEGISKIEIFNTNSRNIFKSIVNDNVIDINISTQAPGLYFIKIFLSEGIITRKIILF